MAYQMAYYHGKYYARRTLVKALYNVGDAGLIHLLAQGKISVELLLGESAYVVGEPGKFNTRGLDIEISDLDCQLGKLKKSSIKSTKRQNGCLFCLGDYHFLALEDVGRQDKYRWVRAQPHVKVFGKKYVAIDAVHASV